MKPLDFTCIKQVTYLLTYLLIKLKVGVGIELSFSCEKSILQYIWFSFGVKRRQEMPFTVSFKATQRRQTQ